MPGIALATDLILPLNSRKTIPKSILLEGGATLVHPRAGQILDNDFLFNFAYRTAFKTNTAFLFGRRKQLVCSGII